jgi:hypothetical protein
MHDRNITEDPMLEELSALLVSSRIVCGLPLSACCDGEALVVTPPARG